MPRRIPRDHKLFRDVVAGTTRKELKKFLEQGNIFRRRGKNGRMSIPIPRINLPHIRYGQPNEGVGRGEGDQGDVVGRDPGQKEGDRGAGDSPGEGMLVDIDMKDILDAMQAELQLPNPRKRENDIYEEIRIKYNGLSKVGPASLLHKRKTMLQCMKRMSALGKLNDKLIIPGYRDPVTCLTPITDDKRFRQWNEIKIPSSNAVIFFARDISGSMTPFKCDIVSDMSWWIDCWIRRFYERVERCYILHDTQAKEVDEDRFYKMRMGGGTICSSALKYIIRQMKHRYPPTKWNVYIFYFSDGDNWGGDNEIFCNLIKKELTPDMISLLGCTQILPWSYQDTLKEAVDKKISDGTFDNSYVRTTSIVQSNDKPNGPNFGWGWDDSMSEEARNASIKNAIKDLLGVDKKQSFDNKAYQGAAG